MCFLFFSFVLLLKCFAVDSTSNHAYQLFFQVGCLRVSVEPSKIVERSSSALTRTSDGHSALRSLEAHLPPGSSCRNEATNFFRGNVLPWLRNVQENWCRHNCLVEMR